MRTQKMFKLIPLLALVLLAAMVVAPGCKKKMPKEAPPPAKEEVDITPVEEADTTGQADRTLRMDIDRDLARIQTVYFEFDRSEIVQVELDKIGANADILQKWPDWTVSIEGHCDERGTNEYNLALGERRARAAQRALESEGIAKSRISIVSYGEERPADPGHAENSWSRNRRAEFRINTGM